MGKHGCTEGRDQMKVYLVHYVDEIRMGWEEVHYRGVFSTKEKAREYIKTTGGLAPYHYIREETMDHPEKGAISVAR